MCIGESVQCPGCQYLRDQILSYCPIAEMTGVCPTGPNFQGVRQGNLPCAVCRGTESKGVIVIHFLRCL